MGSALEAIRGLQDMAMRTGTAVSPALVVAILMARLEADPQHFMRGLAIFLIGTAAGVILDPDSLDD